jgi:hypothetical protein
LTVTLNICSNITTISPATLWLVSLAESSFVSRWRYRLDKIAADRAHGVGEKMSRFVTSGPGCAESRRQLLMDGTRRNFLDVVDRFSQNAAAIKNQAQHNRGSGGQFTNLLLGQQPWQEVLRDADDSERGLFTYVPANTRPTGTATAGPAKDVLRKEVVSSTPLRKARNPTVGKRTEPEEYLGAALKLIDE